MIKIAAYLLIGIGIGAAFAFWPGGGDPVGAWDEEVALEDRGPIERRLGEIETSLALERYERQVLADELAVLRDSLTAGTSPAEPADEAGGERASLRERAAELLDQDGDDESRAARLRERFADGRAGRFDEDFFEQRQLDRLVEAGLTTARAQWIMQREEELAMEVLQARYEATQSGAPADEISRIDQSTLLRQEIGDDEYEKYLEGRGRPTTVNVRDVLANSPAQAAGLKEGDQIVAYNGQRVFEMSELNRMTYEGNAGESVAVDVLRDGQPMQVYVSRGPIGISGGGRARSRRR